MGDSDRVHLVILVHGIRDLARWQDSLGDVFAAEALEVAHTSYGRFNLFKFLLPLDFYRKQAADELWTDIRSAKLEMARKYPGKTIDVSIIAHSFGTYIVTRLVEAEFDLFINRIILCGAVVNRRFPFQKIQHRLNPPVLNEVGTRDPWPATADFLTFGYGSAGTTGFNKPFVKDRYHNKAGHNYFLNATFARDYWVPFLRDGTVRPGSENPENPPWWVVLLITFKIKYLLAAAVVLLAIFAALRFGYGADPISVRMGGGMAYWNAFDAYTQEAGEACPLGPLCAAQWLATAITERRYVKVNTEGGSFREIASCGDFLFPPREAPVSRDPVSLLSHLGETYPQCVSVDIDARSNMTISFHKEQMTEVQTNRSDLPDTMWLCGCSAEQTAAFQANN
jgi:hypothetical protein